MPRLLQAVLALVPLLLTPVVIYGLAEGVLDFGGGEKDILLALPWLIWSVVFALSSFFLIYRRWPIGKWVLRALLIATAVLIGMWFTAYLASVLGMA